VKIYLDVCCFNRPFDDQSQERVRMESEAKMRVQDCIRVGILDLVWSFMLDLENAANPFEDRREAIGDWKSLAMLEIFTGPEIRETATIFVLAGLKPLDALHLACAQAGKCAYFLTTDDGILKKRPLPGIVRVVNPIEFIQEVNP